MPLWLALAIGSLAGCTAIAPRGAPPAAAQPADGFDHAPLEHVLARFVDEQGRVDYAALMRERGELDAYYGALAAVSPDSHPERFPERAQRLAYWINAYNAAVLEIVLAHYPIASVRDVAPPRALFFLPRLAGFFFFQRITLGGSRTNLYALENRVIRGRFGEPRIHFAIHCASAGCPRLPREAFRAETLEAQLERGARRFFAEPRNLRLDHGARTLTLSPILDWFRGDFLGWLRTHQPRAPATLAGYAALYAPEPLARELARAADYRLVFPEYDWTLNDRRPLP